MEKCMQVVPSEDTNSEGKHWCVTINNPTEADKASFVVLQDQFQYYVIGNEVGTEGTPHLQCYIVFKRKRKFGAVKKLLPRAHIQLKRGTCLQAADYCKKDGDFTEFGQVYPTYPVIW